MITRKRKRIQELETQVQQLKAKIEDLKAFKLPQVWKPKLKHIWTDQAGKKYYEFESIFDLKYRRGIYAQNFLVMAQRCLTAEAINDYFQKCREAFNKGEIGRGMYIFECMVEQSNLHAEEDSLYLLASVFFIREDEDPETFDMKIAQEKIALWKREADGFFLLRVWHLIFNSGSTPSETILNYLQEKVPEMKEYWLSQVLNEPQTSTGGKTSK